MNIVCVLRASKDFQPEHVRWLKAQCDKYVTYDKFYVYRDVPVSGSDIYNVPLKTDWPKWWAKFEAYGDRNLKGPALILDLDTVIVAPFKPTEDQLKFSWICRHPVRDGFKATEEFNCGAMLVTEQLRKKIFNHFSRDPRRFMEESNSDDQRYFKRYFNDCFLRFQDEFLDQFVSFKLHVVPHGLREDNTFVMFHGKPRPWEIERPWIPKLGDSDGYLHRSGVCSER
jgi:hypothetical protein